MNVTIYCLLHFDHPDSLREEVNNMLADGWELYGSPCVANVTSLEFGSVDQPCATFSQALIKKSDI